MKHLRLTLSVLALLSTVALMSLSTTVLAQPDSQKTFDKLKTLGGSWTGTVTTTPVTDGVQGKIVQVSLRPTSMGNALMHEMKIDGRPDDPITMLYMDGDRLMLTHYCDAGNRPRMQAKTSPDSKTVEFEFVDIAGGTENGHMHHVAFTEIDANHHTEDWTFMAGDQAVRAHFDLQRVK
jgi:hypothetical protein